MSAGDKDIYTKNKVSKRLEAKLSSEKEKRTEHYAARVFTPVGVENFSGKDILRKGYQAQSVPKYPLPTILTVARKQCKQGTWSSIGETLAPPHQIHTPDHPP